MRAAAVLVASLLTACAPAPASFPKPLVRNVGRLGAVNPPLPGTSRRLLPLARSSTAAVFVLRLAPGTLAPHRHPHADELVQVVSGHGRMQLGGETREVGPGDLVVIPRGVVHAVEVTEDLIALRVMSPGEDPPAPP